MYEEIETKGSSAGLVLIIVLVVMALIVAGVIALGPVTANMAEVETQKSAAAQAAAKSDTDREQARQQTAQQADRLRAENTQQAQALIAEIGAFATAPLMIVITVCILIALTDYLLKRREAEADERNRRAQLEAHERNVAIYLLTHAHATWPTEDQAVMYLPARRRYGAPKPTALNER